MALLLPPGSAQRIFHSMTIHKATADLRRRSIAASIPHGHIMGWHAFRRGRASDMLSEGSAISTILQAGGWKSSSVLHFLALDDIQQRLAHIGTIDASDSEES